VPTTGAPPGAHELKQSPSTDRWGANDFVAAANFFSHRRHDARICGGIRRTVGDSLPLSSLAQAVHHSNHTRKSPMASLSIAGFFDIPIDHLTAVPMLAAAAKGGLRDNSVVVAPDLGAVKPAREYGRVPA
jgi:ribose-phosphate pyrophosphokinase